MADGRCMLVWFMFYMLYWGLPLPSIHDGMNRLFYYTIYYSQYVVNVGILYRVLHHICSEGSYLSITSTTYTRYESISSLLITCINCTRSENSHIMVYRYVYPTTGISFVWGWCHVFAFGVACCLAFPVRAAIFYLPQRFNVTRLLRRPKAVQWIGVTALIAQDVPHVIHRYIGSQTPGHSFLFQGLK